MGMASRRVWGWNHGWTRIDTDAEMEPGKVRDVCARERVLNTEFTEKSQRAQRFFIAETGVGETDG